MALLVKHPFASAKSDGVDSTQVQPSGWNAAHTITAALDKVLGTDGASATVQELACTAAGRAVLAAVDAAAQRVALGLGTLAVQSIGNGSVTYATIQNVAHGKMLGRFTAAAGAVEEVIAGFGQCQLTKSSANLLLMPFDGNRLTINSLIETVPDAGVTLSTGGLSANTFYYIYAFMSGVTMTLEASATAYAASLQAGTGIKIKNADATRTLVGAARTDGSTAWVDSATQRFVRSYFNDPGVTLLNSLTAGASPGSSSYVEISSTGLRIEFLVWSGETVQIGSNGAISLSATGDRYDCSIGIDGTTAEDTHSASNAYAASAVPYSVQLFKAGLSEGYHYATVLGSNSAGTATWSGSGTAGSRCTIRAYARRN